MIYNNIMGRKKANESEYKGGLIQKVPELRRTDDKFQFEEGFEFDSYKEPIKLKKEHQKPFNRLNTHLTLLFQ